MKKQEKLQDELMKDLFSHHEILEPSSSFAERVMYRVSVEKKYDPEIYRPIISRTAWIIIAILTSVLVFLSFYFGNGGVGYLDKIFSFKLNLDYSGPEISGIIQKILELFSSTSSVVLYIIAGMLGMMVVLIAEQLFQRRLVPRK
jgi:hypothetical protein